MKLKPSKALAVLAIAAAFCTQPAHALVDLSAFGHVSKYPPAKPGALVC